jgi:serine/threonine protein kinase/WD40 repeat protein
MGHFLDSAGAAVNATVMHNEMTVSIAEGSGADVGPYRLREQLGEGGFGQVFVAEQSEPVRRKVALKIIKPGMDSREVVARFEAERQALALMDHPNIARVFDAGTTQDGLPYFVMELVRGIPVTDYCDQHRLAVRDRLELFLDVCRAVQHAHQKGIIHRDIKPSNVLVTQHDTRAVVKVIDFGVAKAINQQLTDKTIYTRFAQFIGTPLYMSPEQAQMTGLDVDTRTDIYSLGVLLYELLTGTTPLSRQQLQEAAFDEVCRLIREQEAPRPSLRISTLGDLAGSVSTNRQVEPKRLALFMRGDLDWIVMKTLEKDRSRRYETPNALCRDLERFLHEEPVEACPPSAAYRFRKFARRNRSLLVTASLVLVLLVGAAVISGISAWWAQQAAWQADVERDRATEAWQQEARQRDRAETAEQTALGRLLESKLAFADSSVASRQTGQQVETLAAIEEGVELARELGRLNENLLLLRRLAVSALAVPDMKHGKSLQVLENTERFAPVSSDFRLIAALNWSDRQEVVVWANDDARTEIQRLSVADFSNPADLSNPTMILRFGGRGRYLVGTANPGAVVWDVHRGTRIIQCPGSCEDSASFDSLGRMVALLIRGEGVAIFSLPSGERLQTLSCPTTTLCVLHPSGQRIAVERGDEGFIDIVRLEDATTEASFRLPHEGEVLSLAWSGEGDRLAVGQWEVITVFNSRRNAIQELRGHESMVSTVRFNATDPNLLISESWDGTIRCWSIATGDTWFVLGARAPQVSEDGHQLAVHQGLSVHMSEFLPAIACLWLSGGRCFASTISADGRWLAAGFDDGLRLWDLATRRLVADVPTKPVYDVDFDPVSGDLWTCQDKGVLSWHIHDRDGEHDLVLDDDSGQPLDARLNLPIRQLDVSEDGQVLIADRHRVPEALVVWRGNPERPPSELNRNWQMNVAISPNGRLAAIGSSHASGVSVCDMHRSESVTELATTGWSSAVFSHDAKRLFTCSRTAITSWSTEDWQKVYELPAVISSGSSAIGLSRNGQLAAVFDRPGTIRLIRCDDGQEVCSLKPPSGITHVNSLCFSPDSRFLSVACEARGLCLWNLAEIRHRLDALGLDWPEIGETR